jgi:hypothetical protein
MIKKVEVVFNISEKEERVTVPVERTLACCDSALAFESSSYPAWRDYTPKVACCPQCGAEFEEKLKSEQVNKKLPIGQIYKKLPSGWVCYNRSMRAGVGAVLSEVRNPPTRWF